MNDFSKHIGQRIRMYRKLKGMTLEQLAFQIHKSRASLCKYESGQIILDVETLYDISKALNINCEQLIDFKKPKVFDDDQKNYVASGKSYFYHAKKLYFYFYDGWAKKLKTGIINISSEKDINNNYQATLFIALENNNDNKNKIYYAGKVVYGDMLIRFSFVNKYNSLEEDLIYIFNPLELRNFTYGLVTCISSEYLMPCAYKCLISLDFMDNINELKKKLLVSKQEINNLKKLNVMLITNSF